MTAAMFLRCAAPMLALAFFAPEPGSSLGEPTGALGGLVLLSETLRLDLRPLGAGREHVIVDAEYRIANDGAARVLTLTLPTGGVGFLEEAQGGLWIDDTAAKLGPAPAQPVPADWLPPSATPGLDGAGPMPLAQEAWSKDLMAATLEVPPGEHMLRLRYGTRPAPDRSRTPTLWQLAYVLAPARRFSSHRLLEIEVRLPPGWQAAADPPLARAPAGLRGTFAVIPADALALTAQGPITRSAATPLPLEGRPDPRRRALKIGLTVLLLPGLFLVTTFLALRWLTARRPPASP